MTLFSAPNYCGDYDNAGGMMSVDDKLMCSFQVTLWCALYRDTHCSTIVTFVTICHIAHS